jgi:hypothetical protein
MQDEVDDFLSVILGLRSQNPSAIETSNISIQSLITHTPLKVLEFSSLLISTDGVPTFVVQQCLLFLKVVLNGIRWSELPPGLRNSVRTAVVRGVFFEDFVIRSIAALDVALVGSLEFAIGSWGELLPTLEGVFRSSEYSIACQIGAVMAVRELVRSGLVTRASPGVEMIAPTMTGAMVEIIHSADLPIVELREVVLVFGVLLDVFGFVFASEEDRSTLIVVLSRRFQIPDAQLHFALYGALFAFVRVFYSEIMGHMGSLFEITVASFQCGVTELVPPAMDFWSSLARFESAQETNQGIVETAAPHLLPLLLDSLTQIPRDEVILHDFNDRDLSTWGVKCIKAVSRVAAKIVFEAIVQVSAEMCRRDDWRLRAGGLRALACIIRGESFDTRRAFFSSVIPVLFQFATDASVVVRALSFYVLGKTLLHFPNFLEDRNLVSQVLSLCFSVDRSDVLFGTYSVRLLDSTVRALGQRRLDDSSFIQIFDFLMQLLDRPVDPILLRDTGEALALLLESAPEFALPRLPGLLQHFLRRIHDFRASLPGVIERPEFVCANLDVHVVLVHAVTVRLGGGVAPFAVDAIAELLHCLNLRRPLLTDNALVTTTHVVHLAGPAALPFADRIMEILVGLQRCGSPSDAALSAVCAKSLFASLGSAIDGYARDFSGLLIQNLRAEAMPLRAKVDLLYALAEVVVQCEAASPDELLAMLEGFAVVRLDPAHRESDGEIATSFYAAMINGYRAVLHRSPELMTSPVVRKFRMVSHVLDQISKYDAVDDVVVKEVGLLLKTLLASQAVARRLNVFLTRSSVINILRIGWQEFNDMRMRHIESQITHL